MKIKTEKDEVREEGFWNGFWVGIVLTTILWVTCFGIAEWIGVY